MNIQVAITMLWSAALEHDSGSRSVEFMTIHGKYELIIQCNFVLFKQHAESQVLGR